MKKIAKNAVDVLKKQIHANFNSVMRVLTVVTKTNQTKHCKDIKYPSSQIGYLVAVTTLLFAAIDSPWVQSRITSRQKYKDGQ